MLPCGYSYVTNQALSNSNFEGSMKPKDQPRADNNVINNANNNARNVSSGEATVDNEDSLTVEPKTTNKELKKILREDSNWSLKSILITALTSVSVAVISTQLTGLVSSMVLIAMMAFITASVSEIYRVFIALTGLGAKKAASKVLPVLPADSATNQTGTLKDPNSVSDPRVIAESTSTSTTQSTSPVTAALQVVSKAYKLNPEQESRAPGLWKRLFYRIANYTKANPFLLLVILFLGISTSTIAAAYIFTDGEPPQIIEKTVVSTEKISNKDRATIIEEAKNEALEEMKLQQSVQQPVNSDAETEKDLGSLAERLAAMEEKITGLDRAAESETLKPSPSPSTLETSPETIELTEKLKALESERQDLEARIAELENKVALGTTVESQEPTTRPSTQVTPSEVSSDPEEPNTPKVS